jgi:hypothetical protein
MGIIDVVVKIGGTSVVALALFAFLSIATGIGFNQVISGMGNILIGLGGIVLIILIIFAGIVLYSRR